MSSSTTSIPPSPSSSDLEEFVRFLVYLNKLDLQALPADLKENYLQRIATWFIQNPKTNEFIWQRLAMLPEVLDWISINLWKNTFIDNQNFSKDKNFDYQINVLDHNKAFINASNLLSDYNKLQHVCNNLINSNLFLELIDKFENINFNNQISMQMNYLLLLHQYQSNIPLDNLSRSILIDRQALQRRVEGEWQDFDPESLVDVAVQRPEPPALAANQQLLDKLNIELDSDDPKLQGMFCSLTSQLMTLPAFLPTHPDIYFEYGAIAFYLQQKHQNPFTRLPADTSELLIHRDIYQKLNTFIKEQQAAIIIQANFRGHFFRKSNALNSEYSQEASPKQKLHR